MHISVNKKIIIIPIVVIVVIGLVSFSSDETNEKKNTIFHVTLADPNLYVNGQFSQVLTLEKGDDFFRFVPNGSSPKILSITVVGENFGFDEDFQLRNTLHQTGISEYFTWEYDGTHSFTIPESGEVEIIVNSNGNIMGSVSVDILEN